MPAHRSTVILTPGYYSVKAYLLSEILYKASVGILWKRLQPKVVPLLSYKSTAELEMILGSAN
jgi:hypothetical protein